jgi:hypothetical protein
VVFFCFRYFVIRVIILEAGMANKKKVLISFLSIIVVIFVSCGFSLLKLKNEDVGKFVDTGSPHFSGGDTLTLLQDGRVLLTANAKPGFTYEYKSGTLENCKYQTIAELYDPASNKFTPTGFPNAMHGSARSILLNDGRVLLAGTPYGDKKHVEIYLQGKKGEVYDPKTGKFTYVGEMKVPRSHFSMTKLKNDKILIAGGSSVFGTKQWIEDTKKIEIFDPATNEFSIVGELNDKNGAVAVELKDGKILMLGSEKPEIYNPITNKSKTIGHEPLLQSTSHAFLIDNDKILILLSGKEKGYEKKVINTIIYDPTTNKFNKLDEWFQNTEYGFTAIKLNTDRIIVVGGEFCGWEGSFKNVKKSAIFNVKQNKFIEGPKMKNSLYFAHSINLKNQNLLVVGSTGHYKPKAELYIKNHIK